MGLGIEKGVTAATAKVLDNVTVYATKVTSSFFKNVGNILGSAVKNASQAITGAVDRIANWSGVYRYNLKASVKRLEENGKANWAAGNTIPQQFVRDAMINPISIIDGGAEVNIVKGALGMEIKAIARSEKSLLKFEVRNGSLAGKIHPKSGVPFDANGFPDFSKNLYKEGINDVMITPTKNRVLDEAAANLAAQYKKTPPNHTWHHHQQTGRMQLVETVAHRKTGHTGGWNIWGK